MARESKKRMVRVALIKAESEWGNPKGNIRLLEQMARPLEKSGIDVVVTPECFLDGYMMREKKRCTREKLAACAVTGPRSATVRRAARLAALLRSYLVFGALEKDAQGVLRNAAYLLGRNGEHVGTYYKVQSEEFCEPGKDLPIFETDFGLVGLMICADRRWPENVRVLRLKGAELILNPTWGWYGEGNTCIMQTRAYENGVPVCFTHPKQSLICLPDGTVGAVFESNRPGVLIHDLDLSANPKPRVTKEKAGSHPIQNRRPELYGAIVELKAPLRPGGTR